MKVLFVLLRIITALAALASMAATVALILLEFTVDMIKGGVGVVASLATLFASGFQKSRPVPDPPGTPLPLIGLLILFVAMFVSVFLPSQKVVLHVFAAMAAVAVAWRFWTMSTNPESTLVYLPVFLLWFVYYAVCLRLYKDSPEGPIKKT